MTTETKPTPEPDTTLAEVLAEKQKLEREFEEFKVKVAQAAHDGKVTHGWCSEIDDIIGDLGLGHIDVERAWDVEVSFYNLEFQVMARNEQDARRKAREHLDTQEGWILLNRDRIAVDAIAVEPSGSDD